MTLPQSAVAIATPCPACRGRGTSALVERTCQHVAAAVVARLPVGRAWMLDRAQVLAAITAAERALPIDEEGGVR